MTSIIHHRGPDDEGYFIDAEDGVYLGFRRLSIIDLSENGHQPMLNDDRSITIVFNGEIYNFIELRTELLKLGHRFNSRTDTEVILRAYEQWGEVFVERLRGMFAIVIWDARKKALIVFRDRLGIKPFYYFFDRMQFAFASEAKALFAVLPGLRLSEEALHKYILFPYLPDNQNTVVEQVKKLPAGHKLVLQNNKLSINPFWELEKAALKRTLPSTLEGTIEELDELLQQSIRMRLVADVPLGVMLSGGLDSSYITAVSNRLSTLPVQSFTIGLDHALDERSYAKQVADYVGTRHTELTISSEGVFDHLENIVSVFDDLSTSDGGIISVYLMCQKIKETGIKVLLLGEGADEIFAGYAWFGISQLPFSLMPKLMQTWLYYHGFAKMSFQAGAASAIRTLMPMVDEFQSPDRLRVLSRYELKYQLPNNFLMKVDKASMAHSIEARVPFMDHKVVEYAFALDSKYKLCGRWASLKEPNEKFVLRKCAQKYLPAVIASRKKQGFLLSVPDMIKANLGRAQETLQGVNSVAKDLIGRKQLADLFVRRRFGFLEKQRLNLIWKLYLLELWNKHVLASPSK